MVDTIRIRPSVPMPPIVLAPAGPRRVRDNDTLPRLARIACAMAALALPALGVAAADTVHGIGAPRAAQAASIPPASGPVGPQTAASNLRLGGRP